MGRSALEVADIFREHGPTWREAQRGHLSLAQLKVMSAITQCRTAALGGHVLRCDRCGQDEVSYNSCRNRHCPKCQGGAAKRWLGWREADQLKSTATSFFPVTVKFADTTRSEASSSSTSVMNQK